MNLPGVSPLIDTLSPGQVAAYLRRRGWLPQAYPNRDLLVFLAPRGGDLSLVVPARQDFADYPAKLRDCVRVLAHFSGNDPQTVVHHIAHWDRDVVRIRLQSPLREEQLLPLDYAAHIIALYRDFVAFAATTETQPRRFFAKLTSAGKDFAQNCMFGHTFAGSFGLTIECPLDLAPELPMPDAPPPRPFRRAVTERIAAGQADIASAVAQDDPDVIVRNHQMGFSGNMCELLADIYELADGRDISQRIIWSPELSPPPRLVQAEEPLMLDQRSHRVLKAAAAALQTVEEPDEDKTLVGRVTRLRSEMPPVASQEFASATRTIVVLWEIERQQSLHVHIDLQLDLYRLACDAHKNGRKIKILGKPKKIGKFWRLVDPHDFEVI